MRFFWRVPLLALPLHVLAADDAKKSSPRTTRLGVCSKEARAKGLKGEERKKFVSACIASSKAAKGPAAPPPPS